MERSKDEKDDQEQFELHKSVFDNDLKKLNQIIKFNNGVIDKKVRIKRKMCVIVAQSNIADYLICVILLRTNMETQRCIWLRCWARKVSVKNLREREIFSIFLFFRMRLSPAKKQRDC